MATNSRLVPLRDLLVVEIASNVAGPYCGKLLHGLGARVVKIETEDGDPSRAYGPFPDSTPNPELSGLFIYCNAGKESVVLDLEDPAALRHIQLLLAQADVLIDDLAPLKAQGLGLDQTNLAVSNPKLIQTSITPFGQLGQYTDWKAQHLTISHAGGEGYTMPGPIGHPKDLYGDRPPVQAGGLICDYAAGLAAAMGTLAALAERDITGLSQHVDIARWEVELLANRQSLDYGINRGRRSARYSLNTPSQMLFPCKDGLLFLTFHRQEQFERLTVLLNRPSLVDDPNFATAEARLNNLPTIYEEIATWLADKEAEQVFDLMESRGMIVAYYPTPSQVRKTEQVRELGLFSEYQAPDGTRLQLPQPFYFSACEFDTLQAPRLGAHTTNVLAEIGRTVAPPADRAPQHQVTRTGPTGPLSGIRILEFTWILAGPFATHLLSCLGADVIKVESSQRLDTARFENFVPVEGADPDLSHDFAYVNHNKRSVVLDLKHPAALDVVYDLVKTCDAVVDNMRPGVMETLALGPEILNQHNPTLVTMSASGFGPTGPRKDYPAIAAVFAGSSSFSGITGYPDGPPTVTQTPVDVRAATTIAFALQAALLERTRTGRGVHLDVASFASIVCLIGHVFAEAQLSGKEPMRGANAHPYLAPHGVYRCKGDDQWVSIAVANDKDWQSLCHVLGRSEISTDLRYATALDRKKNETAIDEIINAWTLSLEPMDVSRRLQIAGIAAFPSMSNFDVRDDPHLSQRSYFGLVGHPRLGQLTTMRPPWLSSSFNDQLTRSAPLLGEHTKSILSELIGYDQHTITQLETAGLFV